MHFFHAFTLWVALAVLDIANASPQRGGNNNNNNGQNNNNNAGNNNDANAGNNNNNNGGGGGGGGTTLDAGNIQDASASDGSPDQGEGQSPSLTDDANFINFCSGKQITNGQQNTGGSCNGIVMGDIPSQGNMISSIIVNPAPGENINADTTFQIQVQTNNLVAGTFTNPQTSYYGAPQQLQGGKVVGHTHVTVQDLGGSLTPNTPPDASTFAFFLGINDDGNGNGLLSATVNGGLPAGNYRVCTMTSSSNHQPVLMPVAQRGAQDDCTKFTVGGNGGGNNGGANNNNNNAGGGAGNNNNNNNQGAGNNNQQGPGNNNQQGNNQNANNQGDSRQGNQNQANQNQNQNQNQNGQNDANQNQNQNNQNNAGQNANDQDAVGNNQGNQGNQNADNQTPDPAQGPQPDQDPIENADQNSNQNENANQGAADQGGRSNGRGGRRRHRFSARDFIM